MSAALLDRARAWAAADPDEATRSELLSLVDQAAAGAPAALADLAERLAGPLEFGTAGLRGVIGAGESRMNRAVIRRTSAGLAAHLLAAAPGARERGVVVGYDGRHFSREFAEDTAAVLARAGLRVHLFPTLCATPLVAFGVLDLGAAAGVMVTASHNPPEYNGYKVYWGNGAQIIPPHDHEIARAIEAVGPAREVPLLGLDEARARGLVCDIPDELTERYLQSIERLIRSREGRAGVTIVYTPLHGTGDRYTREALRRAGFDRVLSVPEQQRPDGDFPTVAFPNPEERGALDLAFALGRQENADLIIANDPDADRLAIAIPDGAGGFRQLTGNEVGVLLGDHALRTLGEGPGRLAMTTIVSSPMLGHVARALGARYEETLTGLKWIASRALELEASGARFAFGYEEALGYMIGTAVRDKDGISAATVFAELAALARARGGSVASELERLARTHGLFVSTQRNLTRKGAAGAAEIAAMMERLRTHRPTQIAGRDLVAFTDVQAGVRYRGDAREPLSLPASNVLVMDLAGDARVVARPSGTEPKIKFYFDLREEVAPGEPFATARERADRRLDELATAFISVIG
jgi:phosphomannomutase